MRPHDLKYFELKKCVNSCLLCVRLVVESIFGVSTQRVRVIFVMLIAIRVDLADLIVKASRRLYNFYFDVKCYFEAESLQNVFFSRILWRFKYASFNFNNTYFAQVYFA